MSTNVAVENFDIVDMISPASLDILKIRGSSSSFSNRRNSQVSLKVVSEAQTQTPQPLLLTPKKHREHATQVNTPASLPATPVKTPMLHSLRNMASPPDLTMPSPQPIAFRPLASASKHIDDLLKAQSTPKRVISTPRFSTSAFARAESSSIPIYRDQHTVGSPRNTTLPSSPRQLPHSPQKTFISSPRAALPLSPRSAREMEDRMTKTPTKTPNRLSSPFVSAGGSPQQTVGKSGFFKTPNSERSKSGFFNEEVPFTPSSLSRTFDSIDTTEDDDAYRSAFHDDDLPCISFPLTDGAVESIETQSFVEPKSPSNLKKETKSRKTSLLSPRLLTHPLSPTRSTHARQADTRTVKLFEQSDEKTQDPELKETDFQCGRLTKTVIVSSIPEEDDEIGHNTTGKCEADPPVVWADDDNCDKSAFTDENLSKNVLTESELGLARLHLDHREKTEIVTQPLSEALTTPPLTASRSLPSPTHLTAHLANDAHDADYAPIADYPDNADYADIVDVPVESACDMPSSRFSFALPQSPFKKPGNEQHSRKPHPFSLSNCIATNPQLLCPRDNGQDMFASLTNVPAEALASTAISSSVIGSLIPQIQAAPVTEPVSCSVLDLDDLLEAAEVHGSHHSAGSTIKRSDVLPSTPSRYAIFPCASPRRRTIVTTDDSVVNEQNPLLLEAARALTDMPSGNTRNSRVPLGNSFRNQEFSSPHRSSSHNSGIGTRTNNARPIRVMDAPNIVNDFYLSLVDWSSSNILAAALNDVIYLWHAATDTVTEFGPVSENHGHICAVKWAPDATCLAVTYVDGTVERFDTETQTRVGGHHEHTGRVGAASWAWGCLTTGGRDGQVCMWDTRTLNVDTIGSGTCGEICGLAWSPDELCLAVGANDNVAEVYERRYLRQAAVSLRHHRAAVKALAWCPTQARVLATGGGSGDRHLRIFDTVDGALLRQVDTENQVSSLIWNGESNELLSAHGYANHNLVVWDADTLTSKMQYTSHIARVLCTAVSPDGRMVCSAGADETLRLWEVWPDNGSKFGKNQNRRNNKSAMMSIGSPTKGLSFR